MKKSLQGDTVGGFTFPDIRSGKVKLAALIIVLCFIVGNDVYNARAAELKRQEIKGGKKVAVNYFDALRDAKRRRPFYDTLSKNRVTLGNVDNQIKRILAGGDTCPGTRISALPFTDSGTTVGLTDNYNLPSDTTAPTLTGCPSCTATGTGTAGSLPRGAVYTGTGTGPDAAYSVSFSSSNNSLNVSMTPAVEDLALIVYTDVCSSNLADGIVISDAGGSGQQETVTISTMPAGTYSIVVDGYSSGGAAPGPSGAYTLNVTGTGTVAVSDAPVDMNGDGKTDYVVARNTGGGASGALTWFTQLNGGAVIGTQWGIASDKIVTEDFDGDGKDDVTVWRPGTQSTFYILQSATSTVRIDNFGQTGDDSTVVGDYDGDGKADVAVFRAGANSGDQSVWYYRGSLNNAAGNITFVPWGQNGDFPAPGDYDGDGKNDFVIQRNAGGGGAAFWRKMTTAGTDVKFFGTPTDVIVPGDYDGDGKTDIAVVRGSAGNLLWWVLKSSDGTGSAAPAATFGASATDFVAHGDYDGDGKTDIAVWRPDAVTGGTFWVQKSTGGVSAVAWGANGDFPVAAFNRH